jgi:hypothetical protein
VGDSGSGSAAGRPDVMQPRTVLSPR